MGDRDALGTCISRRHGTSYNHRNPQKTLLMRSYQGATCGFIGIFGLIKLFFKTPSPKALSFICHRAQAVVPLPVYPSRECPAFIIGVRVSYIYRRKIVQGYRCRDAVWGVEYYLN